MAYPEKLLAQDEDVVRHLHPHWIRLVPATLWFVVLCVAAGFGIGYAPDSGTARTVVIGIIVVVALGLMSWLSFAPWIQWRTTHYVFTTHRVLIRRGVLHHTGRDISLQRISDVAFSQSLWDRIVRAGTLTIESAGEHGQETLHDIPRSDEMQQLLNQLIEQDEDRRQRGHAQAGGQYPPGQYAPGGYPPPGQQYPPNYPTQGYPQAGPGYPPTQQYPPAQ